MSINKNLLYILEKLSEAEEVIETKEIFQKLKHLKLSLRQVQAHINKLEGCSRVVKFGVTNSTQYLINPLQKPYRKYRFIFVYKKNERAGLLVQREDDYVFVYDSTYLIHDGEEIPTLPISIEPLASKLLFPIFEENLPEGINKEIMEVGMRKTDDIDKLSTLTHNIGDLHFSFSDKMENVGNTPRESFLSNKNKILGAYEFPNVLVDYVLDLREEEIFPEDIDLTSLDQDNMSGISGFQYKKLMNINFDKKLIDEDALSRGYIFKPYSKYKSTPNSKHYLPHLAINEHLFMSFAKNELNFDVPTSFLFRKEDDEEYHYLVKRFDRIGSYKYAKVTFATFLGLRSENKYKTSSEKMFTRIKRELRSKDERMKLLKYYFYSMLIVHEDMHTKNLSLILDKDITLMAPLYDIASTRIYPLLKGYESHIPIDGQTKHITPKNFKVLVNIMEIDLGDFKKEADAILEAYVNILPKYIQRIDTLDLAPMVYKMKRKILRGTEVKYSLDKHTPAEPLSKKFLEKHKERVKELTTLGWL